MRRPILFGCLLPLMASLTWAQASRAQLTEDPACRSPNPGDWPDPAKPLFMIVIDSSSSMGSMSGSVGPTSCEYTSQYRSDHARCAVSNTVQAFSGLADFGLAQFAVYYTDCSSTCFSGCDPNDMGDDWWCGDTDGTPVPSDGTADETRRRGANILVPLSPNADAAHFSELLGWVDDDCTGNVEAASYGNTPLGGVLRDMYRYLSDGWTPAGTTVGPTPTLGTPLLPADPECRSVNVILLTDGDESCDSDSAAPNAAAELLAGFNLADDDPSRPPRRVHTYVINFIGGDQAATDDIAAAGGTDSSLFATNEAELSAGLADIIAGAIEPETCDNADNNCNGCTDEGYRVYCNRRSADCCEWTDEASRTACLDSYSASIITDPPEGDLALLPCWDPTTDSTFPEEKWLCRDPGEICDDTDNNCEWDYNEDAANPARASEVDEGFVKCPECPSTEVCDFEDNDCNGEIDELPECPDCVPSTEVCDTLDNDCDGQVDEADAGGSLTIPCALTSAANCQGTRTCTAGSYGDCVVTTTAEVCDGIDNDCNGQVDEGDLAEVCEPAIPPGRTIVYQDALHPDTTCTQGEVECGSTCVGAVGPTTEICDGLDNDCDGDVDIAYDDSDLPMVGDLCGACDTGHVVCENGALTCEITGTEPAEICDGADNDCDGLTDEAPLADAPVAAGCWATPGTGCDPAQLGSFGSLQWCAPAGATPTGLGSLLAPCQVGNLQCVAGSWACQQSRIPSAEVCDGVNNDCDGATDEDLTVACSLTSAANCQGTRTCTAGSFGACNVSTTAEVCDGLDNDCDGLVNEEVPGTPCEPALPDGRTSLVYNDGTNNSTSSCRRGATPCGGTTCVGAVGPTAEVCDGVDNDCDGRVDVAWNDSALPSVGLDCGACDMGRIVCEGGELGCQMSGTVPAEVCDGADNDCDGLVDEAPLADAPNSAGCWSLSSDACDPGDVCSWGSLQWCAPEGATCTDAGTLSAPCSAGALRCTSGAWSCQQETRPDAESCDGVDNDCDSHVDEGADGDPLSVSCVLPNASHCQGSSACVNGSYGTCSVSSTSAEVCDSVDNDCNGLVDDGIPGTVCEPAVPDGRSSLVYNDGTNNLTTTCQRGQRACGSATCAGAVGPSSEICDGLDNDCDGVADVAYDGALLPMTGGACGACGAGVVSCVNGALVCVASGTLPVETCDGLDNDCDGQVDESPLADAPAESGCWTLEPEACDDTEVCRFGSLAWCPPEGATCAGSGELSEPCAAGSLQCVSGGWVCQQDSLPSAEVCDGADNDCDGGIDDALESPVGEPCGDDIGACTTGVTACDNGALVCTGTGPQAETCNGVDDDCDGAIDNGIPVGGACSPAYEAASYPGSRTGGACQEGRLECDPEGSGQLLCMGGVGPQSEVCDAIDNDCDGRVDEAGSAPDGVDGTADPTDPSRILGAACGASEGVCLPGTLACINGVVACEGGVGAQVEECDCEDNDCDGTVDDSDPPICSPGKSCVATGGRCICAAPCTSGEFACASGSYDCQEVTLSGADDTGRYCIPPDPCAGCDKATVLDSQGGIECASSGTDADGASVPVCVCVAQACHSPCFGIVCDSGLRCATTGTAAGTCREESCYFFGCASGSMCRDGACVADPCADSPCVADEACKSTSDGSDARCVPSCADVMCGDLEHCVEGECEPTGCDEDCGETELCLADGQCGVSLCETSSDEALPCSDGSYCEPTTGSCVDDPCAGVHCPSGQECASGECVMAADQDGNTAGAGGGTSTDDDDGGGGGQAGTTEAPTVVEPEERGVWALATGGGGCSCRVQRGSGSTLGLSGLLLAAILLRRRRKLHVAAERGGLL